MSEAADPNLPVIVAFVSASFAPLGGFIGAWLARRTEYEKWLRQERSSAFAEFMKQLHAVREKAIDAVHAVNLSPLERDAKVTELFLGRSGHENIARRYL